MKTFLEHTGFEVISEEDESIDNVDLDFLQNNLEKLNDELDTGTEQPYGNAPIMLVQLRGILERYGIQLPQSAQDQFIDLSAEMVYSLVGDYHLYVVYDTNDTGFVEGYAQVVDSSDLDDLMDMDSEEWMENNPPPRRWIPPARKDDDSGNSDEY